MERGIDMNTDEVRAKKWIDENIEKILFLHNDTDYPHKPTYLMKKAYEGGYQQATKDSGLDRVGMISAIGRVDTLHAENERLKDALKAIRDKSLNSQIGRNEVWNIANEALKEANHGS